MKKFHWAWLYLPVILLLGVLFFLKSYHSNAPKAITWNEFEKNILDRHAADSIDVINGEEAQVYIKKEFADTPYFKPVMKPWGGQALNYGPHYEFGIGSVETLDRRLDEAQRGMKPEERVKVSYTKKSGYFINLISWLLPLVLLWMLWRKVGRSYGAGSGGSSGLFQFGDLSSGALDDLEKVTKEAYRMVTFYGFDAAVGPVSFYDSTGNPDATFQKPYSEATGHLIDMEVRKIISDAYQRSRSILEQHRSHLDQLAGLLLTKEMVYKEDIEKIVGPRPQ